jgi:hypothetical protein
MFLRKKQDLKKLAKQQKQKLEEEKARMVQNLPQFDEETLQEAQEQLE